LRNPNFCVTQFFAHCSPLGTILYVYIILNK
jgi:hypothetical protein